MLWLVAQPKAQESAHVPMKLSQYFRFGRASVNEASDVVSKSESSEFNLITWILQTMFSDASLSVTSLASQMSLLTFLWICLSR